MAKKVLVIMGSDSDYSVMKKCLETLKEFGVEFSAHISSAHRSPEKTEALAKNAKNDGFGVVIAAAGKAAHLAGVISANTTLPCIGVPMKSSTLDGLDSLLSTVQMPAGIPVATVAVDGAANAALLAIQILALSDDTLSEKLAQYKKSLADSVTAKDEKLQKTICEEF